MIIIHIAKYPFSFVGGQKTERERERERMYVCVCVCVIEREIIT